MDTTVRNIADCDPKVLDTITAWHRAEWGDEWARQIQTFSRDGGIPTIFVAFVGETPVGTAMLVNEDMVTRPDLFPWLGGVYVLKDYRKHGLGSRLTRCVMELAAKRGIKTLWLYTAKASHVYRDLGWVFVEEEFYPPENQKVVIMKYDFP